MPNVDLFDSFFSDDADGEFSEPFIVIFTTRAKWSGFCATCDRKYKVNDIVGKLERSDNPMLPSPGWCCNRCVRVIPHKSAPAIELRDL